MAQKSRHFYPMMDLMRYALALGVLVAHFNELYGASIPYFLRSFECVGGFFALSGFLMFPSFEKHGGSVAYVLGRARRILPPYFFIVLLCAAGLAAVSSLGTRQYFGSAGLWQYLAANLSFLNWLHPSLPGVFGGEAVNGSLWTMKVEWALYLSVPVFAWLMHRLGIRPGLLAVSMIVLSMLYRFGFSCLASRGYEIGEVLARQVFGQMGFFYMGMLLWFYRDAFRRNLWLWICLGVIMCMAGRNSDYASIFLNPVGVSLVCIGVSLLTVNIPFLRRHYNLSYGIYLFHFPIIRLAVYFGLCRYGTAVAFAAVAAASVALAILNSRLIDRLFLPSR